LLGCFEFLLGGGNSAEQESREDGRMSSTATTIDGGIQPMLHTR
jgi:hypothetical protein